MALPQFSDLFVDKLTEDQIDPINAAFELRTLKEICLDFNNKLPDERNNEAIEIEDIKDDKIGMILALWMRNISIPESITWDDPYDKELKKSLKHYIGLFTRIGRDLPKVKDTPFYTILSHPEQLLGFLVTFIAIKDNSYSVDSVDTYEKSYKHLDNFRTIMRNLGISVPQNLISLQELLPILPNCKPLTLSCIALISSYNEEYDYSLMHIRGITYITNYVDIYRPRPTL